MRFQFAFICAAILLVVTPSSAQEVSKEAKVERLLMINGVEAQYDRFSQAVWSQFLTQVFAGAMPADATPEDRAQATEAQRQIEELIMSETGWAKSQREFVRLFSETFTMEEVDGMLEFYESPVGQAMVKKIPELMAKGEAFGNAQMQEVLPKIRLILSETMGQ